MSDLNLNFDTGSKSISLGSTPGSGNLGFLPDLGSTSPIKTIDLSPTARPKLSVADASFEILTKGKAPDPVAPTAPSSSGSPKRDAPDNSGFSFFKPSTPTDTSKPTSPFAPSQPNADRGGIVDGGLKSVSVNPDEAIFMNKEASGGASDFQPVHQLTPQGIKNEKIDLIYKFKKLENQGIRTTMNYNMNSHLEDMRNEYIKLKKQREVDNSIKFQRKMMMACVTGLEFLNNRFDPFSVKLDGWSESVNENLNDYDEIFEELGEKYGGAGEMSPEIRLLFTLAGSAFMFHLTNTMFKSSIPGMDDVLRQNPELMQQFAQAAVGTMNKGPPPQGFNQGPPQMQQQQQQQPQQRGPEPPNPLAAMMGLGGGGGGGGNPLASMMGQMMGPMMGGGQSGPSRQASQGGGRSASPARSDMSGPDGIDELITKMNLEPTKIPDLDTLSLMSGDSDRKSNSGGGGITLNL
jgi:hypothetical protein